MKSLKILLVLIFSLFVIDYLQYKAEASRKRDVSNINYLIKSAHASINDSNGEFVACVITTPQNIPLSHSWVLPDISWVSGLSQHGVKRNWVKMLSFGNTGLDQLIDRNTSTVHSLTSNVAENSLEFAKKALVWSRIRNLYQIPLKFAKNSIFIPYALYGIQNTSLSRLNFILPLYKTPNSDPASKINLTNKDPVHSLTSNVAENSLEFVKKALVRSRIRNLPRISLVSSNKPLARFKDRDAGMDSQIDLGNNFMISQIVLSDKVMISQINFVKTLLALYEDLNAAKILQIGFDNKGVDQPKIQSRVKSSLEFIKEPLVQLKTLNSYQIPRIDLGNKVSGQLKILSTATTLQIHSGKTALVQSRIRGKNSNVLWYWANSIQGPNFSINASGIANNKLYKESPKEFGHIRTQLEELYPEATPNKIKIITNASINLIESLKKYIHNPEASVEAVIDNLRILGRQLEIKFNITNEEIWDVITSFDTLKNLLPEFINKIFLENVLGEDTTNKLKDTLKKYYVPENNISKLKNELVKYLLKYQFFKKLNVGNNCEDLQKSFKKACEKFFSKFSHNLENDFEEYKPTNVGGGETTSKGTVDQKKLKYLQLVTSAVKALYRTFHGNPYINPLSIEGYNRITKLTTILLILSGASPYANCYEFKRTEELIGVLASLLEPAPIIKVIDVPGLLNIGTELIKYINLLHELKPKNVIDDVTFIIYRFVKEQKKMPIKKEINFIKEQKILLKKEDLNILSMENFQEFKKFLKNLLTILSFCELSGSVREDNIESVNKAITNIDKYKESIIKFLSEEITVEEWEKIGKEGKVNQLMTNLFLKTLTEEGKNLKIQRLIELSVEKTHLKKTTSLNRELEKSSNHIQQSSLAEDTTQLLYKEKTASTFLACSRIPNNVIQCLKDIEEKEEKEVKRTKERLDLVVDRLTKLVNLVPLSETGKYIYDKLRKFKQIHNYEEITDLFENFVGILCSKKRLSDGERDILAILENFRKVTYSKELDESLKNLGNILLNNINNAKEDNDVKNVDKTNKDKNKGKLQLLIQKFLLKRCEEITKVPENIDQHKILKGDFLRMIKVINNIYKITKDLNWELILSYL